MLVDGPVGAPRDARARTPGTTTSVTRTRAAEVRVPQNPAAPAGADQPLGLVVTGCQTTGRSGQHRVVTQLRCSVSSSCNQCGRQVGQRRAMTTRSCCTVATVLGLVSSARSRSWTTPSQYARSRSTSLRSPPPWHPPRRSIRHAAAGAGAGSRDAAQRRPHHGCTPRPPQSSALVSPTRRSSTTCRCWAGTPQARPRGRDALRRRGRTFR